MHKLWSFIALAVPIFGISAAVAAPRLPAIQIFQFEQQAQQHCPADSVVWAIAGLGIYNSSAERWYGQTKDGAYACLGDARAAGYLPAAAGH
jgi:hypothetical protein